MQQAFGIVSYFESISRAPFQANATQRILQIPTTCAKKRVMKMCACAHLNNNKKQEYALYRGASR